MKINLIVNFFKKHKFLLINVFIMFLIIYFSLTIFYVNIKSFFIKPLCNHCNVILISLDTLGANHLPCYGYNRNTAPNLCNFANNNVMFTKAFSNASWTLPSHFSIFTSLYPNHHNMVNYDTNILNSDKSTMAELFKKAGYNTVYVGPLDNTALPLDRGIERGFDSIISSVSKFSLAAWEEPIKQLIKNNNNNKSTFLFLHTSWVHSPYSVDEVSDDNNKRIFTNDSYPDIPLDWLGLSKFSKEFKDYIISYYEYKINIDNTNDKKNDRNIVNSLKGTKDLAEAEKIYNKLFTDPNIKSQNISKFYISLFKTSNEKISYARSLYDEMIFYLDKRLSMIFDLVSNSKLANNTIIIITSDHGEEFMEHGAMEHSADHLYNTTTTVPLIMYIPGIKQKRVDSLVQSIDILPTVLNLTGLSRSNNHFDGINLTNSILGRQKIITNDYLISEGPNDSIRNNRWKLYATNDFWENSYELYDLQNDPLEQNNLYQEEPVIAEDLLNNLNKIIYKK